MGKLRLNEGNDQLGAPACHLLSQSSGLGQGSCDHRPRRGRGYYSANGGGTKVLGWKKSHQGDRKAGPGLGWGGEEKQSAESRRMICHDRAHKFPKWRDGGWEDLGLGTRREEAEVGPPRWARPRPPRDASRPPFGPALPTRLPAAPRGLTCSRGGCSGAADCSPPSGLSRSKTRVS